MLILHVDWFPIRSDPLLDTGSRNEFLYSSKEGSRKVGPLLSSI